MYKRTGRNDPNAPLLESRRELIPRISDELVESFPLIAATMTEVLGESFGNLPRKLSKRAAVTLWIINLSASRDRVGIFIETSDLISIYGKWAAVSPGTAIVAVSIAKKELFEGQFVMSAVRPKRWYLTEKGCEVAQQMLNQTKTVMESRLAPLTDQEIENLGCIVAKILEADLGANPEPMQPMVGSTRDDGRLKVLRMGPASTRDLQGVEPIQAEKVSSE